MLLVCYSCAVPSSQGLNTETFKQGVVRNGDREMLLIGQIDTTWTEQK